MRGPGQSLTKIKYLFLSSFTVDDVKSCLDASPQLQRSLVDMDACAYWLHRLTAGVPRLVQNGIDSLMRTFKSNERITMEMIKKSEYNVRAAISEAPMAIPNYLKNTSHTIHQDNNLLALLYAAASGLCFDLDAYLPGVPNYPLRELIDRYSIYVSHPNISLGDDNRIELLFPGFWRNEIKYIPAFDFLIGLDSAFIDKGKALEVVLERMITLRCNFRGTPIRIEEALPFLVNRKTCVSNMFIRPLVSHKVVSKITSNTTLKTYQEFLFNSSILGKDVLFTFPGMSETADEIIKLGNMLICYQCKNLNDTSNFGLPALNVEIKKTSKIVNAYRPHTTSGKKSNKSEEITEGPSAVFVLVLTGKGTEDIESMRGIVYNSESSKKTTLKIPPNMEVLVLTEEDMEILLGRLNLEVLRNL